MWSPTSRRGDEIKDYLVEEFTRFLEKGKNLRVWRECCFQCFITCKHPRAKEDLLTTPVLDRPCETRHNTS